MLAAPVSGNPGRFAETGRLTIVAWGRPTAGSARDLLELLSRRVTYVGEGERARLVKICHNLMLGVVAQCMAEITVLAEKGGVTRADFLDFLNDSVMGLDVHPLQDPGLRQPRLHADVHPGAAAQGLPPRLRGAREMDVAMPLAAATEQIVQGLAGLKGNEVDFAALIEVAAEASGLMLQAENVEVDDGLSPLVPSANGDGRSPAAAQTP